MLSLSVLHYCSIYNSPTLTSLTITLSGGNPCKTRLACPVPHADRKGRREGARGRDAGGVGGALGRRVQHDLTAEFDQFGAEVLLDELMGGALYGEEEVRQDAWAGLEGLRGNRGLPCHILERCVTVSTLYSRFVLCFSASFLGARTRTLKVTGRHEVRAKR